MWARVLPRTVTLSIDEHVQMLIPLGLALSAAVDTVIALLLLFFLFQCQTEFKRSARTLSVTTWTLTTDKIYSTNRVVYQIAAYTFNSGLLTMQVQSNSAHPTDSFWHSTTQVRLNCRSDHSTYIGLLFWIVHSKFCFSSSFSRVHSFGWRWKCWQPNVRWYVYLWLHI